MMLLQAYHGSKNQSTKLNNSTLICMVCVSSNLIKLANRKLHQTTSITKFPTGAETEPDLGGGTHGSLLYENPASVSLIFPHATKSLFLQCASFGPLSVLHRPFIIPLPNWSSLSLGCKNSGFTVLNFGVSLLTFHL